MRYTEVQMMRKHAAATWNLAALRDIGSELWQAVRKRYPNLPKLPIDSVKSKLVKPPAFMASQNFRDLNGIGRAIRYGADGVPNIKGITRPKFGAGDYKLTDTGFQFRNKFGQVFDIDARNVPIERNMTKAVNSRGKSIYDTMTTGPGKTRKMKVQDLAPQLANDPDWWKKRLEWRKKVPASVYQPVPPEDVLDTRPLVTVTNKDMSGKLGGPAAIGYNPPTDTVMLYDPPEDKAIDAELIANMRNKAGADGFTTFKYGLNSQPEAVPTYTPDGQEHFVSRSTYPEYLTSHVYDRQMPGPMLHESMHALQSGDPSRVADIPDDKLEELERLMRLADGYGIDQYTVFPPEVQQSGKTYKLAVQAAKRLPDEELVRLYGNNAARVKAMSPFATSDRKLYRDLEFLRKHPEVAAQMGIEVARTTRRYANLKQLAWDANRRIGLWQKLNQPLQDALGDAYHDLARNAMLSAEVENNLESVKPSAGRVPQPFMASAKRSGFGVDQLLRLLRHRYNETVRAKEDLLKAPGDIQKIRDTFMDQLKRASMQH